MINLKESLLELASAHADRALAAGGTPAGGEAIARLALLMSLIDTLDSSDGGWEDCDLLPQLTGSGASLAATEGSWVQ